MSARTVDRVFDDNQVCRGDIIDYPSSGVYRWYCRDCQKVGVGVLTAARAKSDLLWHLDEDCKS